MDSTFQEAHQVRTQLRTQIAALLQHHGRFLQGVDFRSDTRVASRRDPKGRIGVMNERIQSQGDDQRVGSKGLDAFERARERLEIALLVNAERQRKVHCRSLTLAAPDLVLVAPEEWREVGRVPMERNELHVAPVVKDVLRTVAVMDVD